MAIRSMDHWVTVFLLALTVVACAPSPSGPDDSSVDPASQALPLPDSSRVDPGNPALPTGAAGPVVDVLLFNGTGVSTSDWQTTEQILKAQGLSYALANSAQLNAMALDELSGYGVLVVPGGKGGTITANLSVSTRLRVRQAVRDRGMGYVGFCAGAWVAVGPEAQSDATAAYGMAIAKGSVLPAYYPGDDTSLVAAISEVTFADGGRRHLVWWGGPSTPEWKNGVVARYVNGDPAISQIYSGKGYVVIAGPHPEAPQSWRSTAGYDPDGLDYDIAVAMVRAARERRPLAAF